MANNLVVNKRRPRDLVILVPFFFVNASLGVACTSPLNGRDAYESYDLMVAAIHCASSTFLCLVGISISGGRKSARRH